MNECSRSDGMGMQNYTPSPCRRRDMDINVESSALAFIKSITDMECPAGLDRHGAGLDLFGWLGDGVVLAHVANAVRPGTVRNLKRIATSIPTFRKVDFIGGFLNVCHILHVAKADLFDTVDLVEGKNMQKVIRCVYELSLLYAAEKLAAHADKKLAATEKESQGVRVDKKLAATEKESGAVRAAKELAATEKESQGVRADKKLAATEKESRGVRVDKKLAATEKESRVVCVDKKLAAPEKESGVVRVDKKLAATEKESQGVRVDKKLAATEKESQGVRVDKKLAATEKESRGVRVDKKLATTGKESQGVRVDKKLAATEKESRAVRADNELAAPERKSPANESPANVSMNTMVEYDDLSAFLFMQNPIDSASALKNPVAVAPKSDKLQLPLPDEMVPIHLLAPLDIGSCNTSELNTETMKNNLPQDVDISPANFQWVQANEEFFNAHMAKPDVYETGGVLYKIVHGKCGKQRNQHAVLTFSFYGTLIDGSVVHSSRTPVTRKLSHKAVLPCWRDVLSVMTVGSEAQVVSLAQLGPALRPPLKYGSVIVYDLTLVADDHLETDGGSTSSSSSPRLHNDTEHSPGRSTNTVCFASPDNQQGKFSGSRFDHTGDSHIRSCPSVQSWVSEARRTTQLYPDSHISSMSNIQNKRGQDCAHPNAEHTNANAACEHETAETYAPSMVGLRWMQAVTNRWPDANDRVEPWLQDGQVLKKVVQAIKPEWQFSSSQPSDLVVGFLQCAKDIGVMELFDVVDVVEAREEASTQVARCLHQFAICVQSLSIASQLPSVPDLQWLAKNESFPLEHQYVPADTAIWYKIVEKADGECPSETSTVTLAFSGATVDGDVFIEQSRISMQIEQLKPVGLRRAVLRMAVGSVWDVVVPHFLAYGSTGSGVVQPYSYCVYTIHLYSINDAKTDSRDLLFQNNAKTRSKIDSRDFSVLQWVAKISGSSLPTLTIEGAIEWLQDGTVLCELHNQMRPSCSIPIQREHQQMDNIQNFIRCASSLGCKESFHISDLTDGRDFDAVLACLTKIKEAYDCRFSLSQTELDHSEIPTWAKDISPSSAPSNRCGEMWKMSRLMWRRRYFVLSAGGLRWWKTEKEACDDMKSLGQLFLADKPLSHEASLCERITTSDSARISLLPHRRRFALAAPTRTILFEVINEDRDGWVHALHDHIGYANAQFPLLWGLDGSKINNC